MDIIASLKTGWNDLFLEAATPHQIAVGFTIGTIITLLPTYGFSVLLVFAVLLFFPYVNKPAAIAAIAVWNPIVQIPLYTIAYGIGAMIFGDLPVVHYDIEILNQFYTFTRRLLVGNLILTSLITMASYGIVYLISLAYLPRPELH